jgi:hypothetical protein
MNAYWKYNLKYSKSLHFPKIKEMPNNIAELSSGFLLTNKKPIIGRSWKSDELRLKSDPDLHKLWYVLVKEKLAIKSDQYQNSQSAFASQRSELLKSCLFKVNLSMQRLKSVIIERQAIRNEFLKFLEFYYIKKKQANHDYVLLSPQISDKKTEETPVEESQPQTQSQLQTPKQRSRVVRAALTHDKSKEKVAEEKVEDDKNIIEEKKRPDVCVLTENQRLQVEILKKKMNENTILKTYVSNSYLLTKQQKNEVKSMIGRARGRQARTIFMKEMAALSYKLKSSKQSENPDIRKLEDLS